MAKRGVTGEQSRAGRAALGFDEMDLAKAAGIPSGAIIAFETGDTSDPATAITIEAALAEGGVTFYTDNAGSARMRARTLDGIIDAPVTFSKQSR